jgi:hypothetical protein
LPFDRPRPADPSQRGAAVRWRLADAGLHAILADLAREHQATMFMVLHAGLAALLSRMGAGTDIPVGAPVAGRTDEAVHDLVGFFVNPLVLRADLSGEPSFAQLLDRVRETVLAAQGRQDFPSSGWSRCSTRLVPRPGTRCSRSCSSTRTSAPSTGSYPGCGSRPSRYRTWPPSST